MIKMIKLSITLLFCLLSFNVYASGWSPPGYTSEIRLFQGYVVLGSLSSLDSTYQQQYCGNSTYNDQFSFSNSDPNAKEYMAMLLSAEMSNRQVSIYFDGNCNEGRPEINGVRIIG